MPTLSIVGIFIVTNIYDAGHRPCIRAQGFILDLEIFGKCARCLNIAVVLEKLHHQGLNKVRLAKAGLEFRGVGRLDVFLYVFSLFLYGQRCPI